MSKKVTFEIEHPNGNRYMAFEIEIGENSKIKVTQTENCTVADIDIDCVFQTDNDSQRIQADEFHYETNDFDDEYFGGKEGIIRQIN